MKFDEDVAGSKSYQDLLNTTGNKAGRDPERKQPEIPLPADDEAPVEQDMADVEANNSVSSEYPQDGKSGRADDPDVDPQLNEQDDANKEPRNVPASDPESGA
jgi:hypothetical protein